jgi:hypothetical protein
MSSWKLKCSRCSNRWMRFIWRNSRLCLLLTKKLSWSQRLIWFFLKMSAWMQCCSNDWMKLITCQKITRITRIMFNWWVSRIRCSKSKFCYNNIVQEMRYPWVIKRDFGELACKFWNQQQTKIKWACWWNIKNLVGNSRVWKFKSLDSPPKLDHLVAIARHL